MSKFLVRFLGAYFRSGFRGSSRLTDFLSRHLRSLHAVPFKTNGGTVYGDLRLALYRGLLTYSGARTDEEIVMDKLVGRGDTAFDIGVYWGLYTAYLSRCVGADGAVHSFEPNRDLHPSLELTAEHLKNVTVHRVGLSDRTGEVNFFVPSEDASMASLTNWTGGVGWEIGVAKCQVTRLDDLVRDGIVPVPDFIKCDVEGAELAVFEGARETLDRPEAPIIMFEVNPVSAEAFGNEADACFRFLVGLERPSYKFFEVIDGRITRVAGFSGLHFNPHGFTNVIAVPMSKCNNVEDGGRLAPV